MKLLKLLSCYGKNSAYIYIMNQLIWSIQFDGTNTALLDRDPNNYRAWSCCSVRQQFEDMESRGTLLTRVLTSQAYTEPIISNVVHVPPTRSIKNS